MGDTNPHCEKVWTLARPLTPGLPKVLLNAPNLQSTHPKSMRSNKNSKHINWFERVQLIADLDDDRPMIADDWPMFGDDWPIGA